MDQLGPAGDAGARRRLRGRRLTGAIAAPVAFGLTQVSRSGTCADAAIAGESYCVTSSMLGTVGDWVVGVAVLVFTVYAVSRAVRPR